MARSCIGCEPLAFEHDPRCFRDQCIENSRARVMAKKCFKVLQTPDSPAFQMQFEHAVGVEIETISRFDGDAFGGRDGR